MVGWLEGATRLLSRLNQGICSSQEAVMANIDTGIVYEIVAGPSREDLFDALRLRHEKREVTFTVKMGSEEVPLRGMINSISIEDGSGNCWLFILYCGSRPLTSQYFSGFLNTRKREGTLRLQLDLHAVLRK